MSLPRRFRPTLWPTLFTIPAMIVLVGLGSWQIDRLQWKSELIATFEARMAQTPVAPPETIDDMAQWRYRLLQLDGVFQHDKEIQMTGRPFEGTAGFHVITPLILENSRVVLINRGWVPEKLRDPKTRVESLVRGLVSFQGILREDWRRGSFVPDNEPRNEVWLYVDTAQMARHRKVFPVAPYYVEAIRAPGPYVLPIGANIKITVRNEHLQYALTWFLLAGTLLVIYVIYHYQRPEPT
jgi:surfeit locus 1 family protein